MTTLNSFIGARPTLTDAFERQLTNDIDYNLGRNEPSVIMSALSSIASRTVTFVSQKLSRKATGRVSKATFNPGIPEQFTEFQARLILALAKLKATSNASVDHLVAALTPARFTPAQADCVLEMLTLAMNDLRETLADAMQPGIESGR